MKSVSKSQKSVATTQVQVSVGISRNEASEAPAQTHKPQIHISVYFNFAVDYIYSRPGVSCTGLWILQPLRKILKCNYVFMKVNVILRSFLNVQIQIHSSSFQNWDNPRQKLQRNQRINHSARVLDVLIFLHPSKWGHCVFTITP